MAEDTPAPRASADEAVVHQQYLRSLSSFEGIILSQIDIKNKLGDRLNYSIRAGLIILGVMAFSILVLLLTLSSQINRISGVVSDMNAHFTSVSEQMNDIRIHMSSMEQRVSLLGAIDASTGVMDQEMQVISSDMGAMETSVSGITDHVTQVRTSIGNIALSIDRMNLEVQAMSQDVHRMAKPARSFNKMFPFFP